MCGREASAKRELIRIRKSNKLEVLQVRSRLISADLPADQPLQV